MEFENFFFNKQRIHNHTEKKITNQIKLET